METNNILDRIYAELKALGVVANQYDFSVMCGRTPAWFSCLKARRLPMTTDAALTLAFRLRRRAQASICSHTHDSLIGISERLLTCAAQQVAKKMELTEQLGTDDAGA